MTMRYSKQISTGLIIESQSGGDPDNPLHLSTMVDNAVGGGIAKADVEVGYCTEAEHDEMLKAKQPAPTYSDKRKAEYPPIGDQLDALWKGGDDAAAMKVIVDKVKSDNPKG
jgi:hypothetical protein